MGNREAEEDRKGGVGRSYRSDQWEEEAGANTSLDVPHWNHKARGHTLLVCVVRKGEVGLCHADWQVAKALKRTR